MSDDLDLYRRDDDGLDFDVPAKLRKENAELREELQQLRWLESDRKNLRYSKWFAAFSGCCAVAWEINAHSLSFGHAYLTAISFGVLLGIAVLLLTGAVSGLAARCNPRTQRVIYLVAGLLLPLILVLFSGAGEP